MIIDFNEEEEEDGQGSQVSEATETAAQDAIEETETASEPVEELVTETATEPEPEEPVEAEPVSVPDEPEAQAPLEDGLHIVSEEEQVKAEDDEGYLQLTDADVLEDPADPVEIAATPEVEVLQEDIAELVVSEQEEPERVVAEVAGQAGEAPPIPAPSSKDDFARAIANLPDAPPKQTRSGPRSLAELTSSIVRLVDKQPSTRENTRLSKPEQDAFDKIARALGAEKKQEPASAPAVTSKSIPVTPEETAALAVAETNVVEPEVASKPEATADNIISLPADSAARDKDAKLRRNMAMSPMWCCHVFRRTLKKRLSGPVRKMDVFLISQLLHRLIRVFWIVCQLALQSFANVMLCMQTTRCWNCLAMTALKR